MEEATSVWVIKSAKAWRGWGEVPPALALPLSHRFSSLFVSFFVNLSDFLPACLFVLRAVCLRPPLHLSLTHTHTHTQGQKRLLWSGFMDWLQSEPVHSSTIVLSWTREEKKAPNRTVSQLILAINQTRLCFLGIGVSVRVCVACTLPPSNIPNLSCITKQKLLEMAAR